MSSLFTPSVLKDGAHELRSDVVKRINLEIRLFF